MTFNATNSRELQQKLASYKSPEYLAKKAFEAQINAERAKIYEEHNEAIQENWARLNNATATYNAYLAQETVVEAKYANAKAAHNVAKTKLEVDLYNKTSYLAQSLATNEARHSAFIVANEAASKANDAELAAATTKRDVDNKSDDGVNVDIARSIGANYATARDLHIVTKMQIDFDLSSKASEFTGSLAAIEAERAEAKAANDAANKANDDVFAATAERDAYYAQGASIKSEYTNAQAVHDLANNGSWEQLSAKYKPVDDKQFKFWDTHYEKYGDCGQPKLDCVEKSVKKLGIDVDLFKGMRVSEEIGFAMAKTYPKLAVAVECGKTLEEENWSYDHIHQKYNDLLQNITNSTESNAINEHRELEVDKYKCERDYNDLSKMLTCAFTGYISSPKHSNKIASKLLALEGNLRNVDPSKLEEYNCEAAKTVVKAFEPEIRQINEDFLKPGAEYAEGLSEFFIAKDVEVSGVCDTAA